MAAQPQRRQLGLLPILPILLLLCLCPCALFLPISLCLHCSCIVLFCCCRSSSSRAWHWLHWPHDPDGIERLSGWPTLLRMTPCRHKYVPSHKSQAISPPRKPHKTTCL